MTRVIGIISGKGGVGKTIVAINLAASLYKYYNKNVLLVDANITTSHVGLYLGLYSTPVTLNDALRGRVNIKKAVYEHSTGMHVLPASLRLEDLKGIKWRDVKVKLEGLLDDYDFIILDSSPGFNRESLITLNTCQEAVFVTNPVVYSAADLIKCKEFCKKFDVRQLGIVVNMVKNKKYEISKGEVEQLVESNVIGVVHYNDGIMESVVSKMPAIFMNRKADGEFRKIAANVMEDYYYKGNWLSRFFGAFRK